MRHPETTMKQLWTPMKSLGMALKPPWDPWNLSKICRNPLWDTLERLRKPSNPVESTVTSEIPRKVPESFQRHLETLLKPPEYHWHSLQNALKYPLRLYKLPWNRQKSSEIPKKYITRLEKTWKSLKLLKNPWILSNRFAIVGTD